MTEMRDGFLSRWSRLKRGIDPAPVDEVDAAGTPEDIQEPALPGGKSLEDLIAELPKLEELLPGQSLASFMQPWVPMGIRNAALQRMWLLDPEISGYVDPALDYAYDYNSLGTVPGFGPMEASQEAVSEVAAMFDRALGRAEAVEQDVQPAADPSDAPADGAEMAEATRSTPAGPAPEGRTDEPADPRPAVRRHGRALPT